MAGESKSIQGSLDSLSRRFRLVAIYAFGSRAAEVRDRLAGRQTDVSSSGSDLDIGVLPVRGHRLTARDRVHLSVALEDLMDVGRVDLVVLPEASPFLALDVVCGELLCTTDADAEAAYQLYVLRRAGDLAPFEHQRRRMQLYREAP